MLQASEGNSVWAGFAAWQSTGIRRHLNLRAWELGAENRGTSKKSRSKTRSQVTPRAVFADRRVETAKDGFTHAGNGKMPATDDWIDRCLVGVHIQSLLTG